MGIFGRRRDKRRWSRRLIDDGTRDFVHDFLEESAETFRTPSGDFHLAALCDDVFEEADITDVSWLRSRGIDGEAFYRQELAPNWEGLTREQRARRIDQFIELSHELGGIAPGGHPPDAFLDMLASVHLKVLLLAWSFDRTYGYMDQLTNGPLQYRIHRGGTPRTGTRED